MKYLHNYRTNAEFTPEYEGEGYLEPWVSYTKEPDRVDYNKNPNAVPLTFRMRESGVFAIGFSASEWAGGPEEGDVIHYSINEGPWQDFTYVPDTQSGWGWEALELQLNEGDTLAVKATLPDRGCYGDFGIADHGGDIAYDVYGNIMSIVDENKYMRMTEFPSSWKTPNFTQFFSSSNVVDASGLIMPLKHVTRNMYALMFSGCSSLVSIPKFQAETVSTDGTMMGMFADCHNLVNVPEDLFMSIQNIEGTASGVHLFDFCGTTCFNRCTKLVEAPILPDIKNADGESLDYEDIFYGCTSLTHIKSYFPGIEDYDGTIDARYFGLQRSTTYPTGGVLEVPAESVPKIVNLPAGWTVQAIED